MTQPGLSVEALTTEYRVDPLGIEEPAPRLAWQLRAQRRGVRQVEYRVRAAGSAELLRAGGADLWDSGPVASSRSVHVAYAGLPLRSRQRVAWRVSVRDESGAEAQAEPATFEMGLLQRSDWQASWVCAPDHLVAGAAEPVVHLRRDLRLRTGIRRARLYATALGQYLLRCNGRRVGDAWMTPGWTDYSVRVPYQVYDVTSLLVPGGNTLGATLAEGWYAGYVAWKRLREHWGSRPQLLLQMEVEYDDGTRETVGTDLAWRVSLGPIVSSGMLMGEVYDARAELPGWDQPAFDDSSWAAAVEGGGTRALLVAQRAPQVRVTEELDVVGVAEPAPGVVVADLGQNMVGWPRLRATLPPGAEVRLRTAEVLDADGGLYTENLRQAGSADTVIGGGGALDWEPSFALHGFRYVEVTGLTADAVRAGLSGRVAHTDAPRSGEFSCSEDLVNRLQRNIVWGQRSNFVEVPTDCPQRDERLGWMGDAQIFVRTATFNMDLAAFFEKWLQDVLDAQRGDGAFSDIAPHLPKLTELSFNVPAWADAGVIVPWVIYERYADRALLERCYPAMCRYVDNLAAANPDRIRRNDRGNDYGDWLNIDDPTPKDLLATAFFAHSADLVSRAGRVLGQAATARRHRRLFTEVRNAFVESYVHHDATLEGGSQTAYALALRFQLLPAGLRRRAVRHLAAAIEARGGLLATGFVGVAHLLPALSAGGRLDLAYRLLLEERFPSWGFSIRHGATTIWERWDGWTPERGFQTPAMNSFNHYSFGAVGQWMYETVAGIDSDPANPGFERVMIRPRPGGPLRWARAEYDSIRGRVVSAWQRDGDRTTFEVTIPANARALLELPVGSDRTVTESGATVEDAPGVMSVRRRRRSLLAELGSGRYRFEVGASGSASSPGG